MRVLDNEISIESNGRLLFDRYRLLFLLLAYSALVDALSTTYFMAQIGPRHEMNAVVRMLSYSYGIVWGPLLGKSLQLAAVWLITLFTPSLTRFICGVVIFLNCYAAFVNIHV